MDECKSLERGKAAVDAAWNALVQAVDEVNAAALATAQEAFHGDEEVRHRVRVAAEREHAEMERAMLDHHKSLETSKVGTTRSDPLYHTTARSQIATSS